MSSAAHDAVARIDRRLSVHGLTIHLPLHRDNMAAGAAVLGSFSRLAPALHDSLTFGAFTGTDFLTTMRTHWRFCRYRNAPIKDKRARLRMAAHYIKSGMVKFPRTGCEYLLQPFLGYGGEKHDDAVDSICYLILGVAQAGIEEAVVRYI